MMLWIVYNNSFKDCLFFTVARYFRLVKESGFESCFKNDMYYKLMLTLATESHVFRCIIQKIRNPHALILPKSLSYLLHAVIEYLQELEELGPEQSFTRSKNTCRN